MSDGLDTIFYVRPHLFVLPQLARDFEMRLQLANRDRGGRSAVMLAARSRSVAIVAALIMEIEETQVKTCTCAGHVLVVNEKTVSDLIFYFRIPNVIHKL